MNEAEVTLEEVSNKVDLSKCLIAVKYIDPSLASTVPSASVVIDTDHPLAPGLFPTLSGNANVLPVHYHMPQGGHIYSLEISPLIGEYWQQVS